MFRPVKRHVLTDLPIFHNILHTIYSSFLCPSLSLHPSTFICITLLLTCISSLLCSCSYQDQRFLFNFWVVFHFCNSIGETFNTRIYHIIHSGHSTHPLQRFLSSLNEIFFNPSSSQPLFRFRRCRFLYKTTIIKFYHLIYKARTNCKNCSQVGAPALSVWITVDFMGP